MRIATACLIASVTACACGCGKSGEGGGREPVAPVWKASPTAQVKPVEPSPERFQALLAALGHEDRRIRRRAVQELTPLINSNPAVVDALLKRPVTTSYVEERWLELESDLTVAALGSAEGAAADKVVRACVESAVTRRRLLVSLARMGARAKGAAPALRADLARCEANPAEAMRLKVALAAIGEATDSERAAIAKAIVEQEEKTEVPALIMIWMIGRNPWVDDETVSSIFHPLPIRLGRPALYAALAAGTLSDKAKPEYIDALRWRFDETETNYGPAPEAYGMGVTLARLDPSMAVYCLRSTQRGGMAAFDGLELYPMREWIAGTTSEEHIADAVVALLKDWNPEVVALAAEFLGDMGPRVRSKAGPELLRIIASARTIREMYAQRAAYRAMGRIGLPADVEALRASAAKADTLVRDDIEEAIQMIQLKK